MENKQMNVIGLPFSVTFAYSLVQQQQQTKNLITPCCHSYRLDLDPVVG